MYNRQSGQSLIEVTFATGVVALILVTLLSGVIQAMQSSRTALEQSRSTQYAQEGLEWVRGERNRLGWGPFLSSIQASGNPVTHCVPTIPADLATLLADASGECATEQVIEESPYRRSITFQVLTQEQIRVTVNVVRPGEQGDVITTQTSLLSDWE